MSAAIPANARDDFAGDKLRVEFTTREGLWRRKRFTAVGDVNLKLVHGETLGIVGELGSGKTTWAWRSLFYSD